MLRIMEREIAARERSAGARTLRKPSGKQPSTAIALMAGTPGQVSCVYCNQSHVSESRSKVKSVGDRRQILPTSGRCFVCLKRRHVSRDCRSSSRCSRCSGRHHTSICSGSRASTGSMTLQSVQQPAFTNVQQPATPYVQQPAIPYVQQPAIPNAQRSTTANVQQPVNVPQSVPTTMYVNTYASILLQTAKVFVSGRNSTTREARVILDLGSQRSYVTDSLRQALT